jgi:hypothetical protein
MDERRNYLDASFPSPLFLGRLGGKGCPGLGRKSCPDIPCKRPHQVGYQHLRIVRRSRMDHPNIWTHRICVFRRSNVRRCGHLASMQSRHSQGIRMDEALLNRTCHKSGALSAQTTKHWRDTARGKTDLASLCRMKCFMGSLGLPCDHTAKSVEYEIALG